MTEKVSCSFIFDDENENRKKLFDVAITNAEYGKVLYILREELNELPNLSQDLNSINKHYMKMLSFLYARSTKLLIEGVCSLNNWRTVPSTIILDNLSEYCGKESIQDACGVVALLIDTARSCSAAANKPCRLYVAVPVHIVGRDFCTTLNDLYGTNA